MNYVLIITYAVVPVRCWRTQPSIDTGDALTLPSGSVGTPKCSTNCLDVPESWTTPPPSRTKSDTSEEAPKTTTMSTKSAFIRFGKLPAATKGKPGNSPPSPPPNVSVAFPPYCWLLPLSLQDPARSTDGFRSVLKTHLFAVQRDV